MQLETIRNSMFALSTVQAAGFVGGFEELQPVSGGSFESQDTFYLDGTVRTDKVQID
jgi:hypothetical protein